MEPSKKDLARIIRISKEDAANKIKMEISADRMSKAKAFLEENTKKQIGKRLDRFREHFPVRSKEGKDLDKREVDQDLLILKGHLLIEELLREFVVRNLPNKF